MTHGGKRTATNHKHGSEKMATATTKTNGRTLTQDTYFVFYGEHNMGSKAGFMVREGLERAQQTERLMGECGYQFTDIRHALSVAEMGNEA